MGRGGRYGGRNGVGAGRAEGGVGGTYAGVWTWGGWRCGGGVAMRGGQVTRSVDRDAAT